MNDKNFLYFWLSIFIVLNKIDAQLQHLSKAKILQYPEQESEYKKSGSSDASTNSSIRLPLFGFTAKSLPYFSSAVPKSALNDFTKIPRYKLLSQLLAGNPTVSSSKELYKSRQLPLSLLLDTCFLESSAPVQLPQNDAQISENSDASESVKRQQFVVPTSDMEPEVGQFLPTPLFPLSFNLNSKIANKKISKAIDSIKTEDGTPNNIPSSVSLQAEQLNKWLAPGKATIPIYMRSLTNPFDYRIFPLPLINMDLIPKFAVSPLIPSNLFRNANINFSFHPFGPLMVPSVKNFHAKIPQLIPSFPPYNLLSPTIKPSSYSMKTRLSPPPPLNHIFALFPQRPELSNLLAKYGINPTVKPQPLMPPSPLSKSFMDSMNRIYPVSTITNPYTSLGAPELTYQNHMYGLMSPLFAKGFLPSRLPPMHTPSPPPQSFFPYLSMFSTEQRSTTSPVLHQNIFPWPNFLGVKRFPFALLCQGQTTFAFGSCSSVYLSCDPQGQQYSFEECPPGQVFQNGICQMASAECFQMRIFRLNMETQYLMEDTHFCMQGEGIYVMSLNQCSRQAIVCTDFYHGFGISCAHDQILSTINMKCVPSPPLCSSWALPPVQFASWKFSLINYYCQIVSEDNHMFGNYGHYEHYCRNWYVDCRPTVRDIITCEKGEIYDIQNRRCRSTTTQDPCFLPPISCSGNNWYSVGLGRCLESFVRCEGGLIRKYLCSEGMVFHEGKCVHPFSTSGTCSVCTEGQTSQLPHEKCNQYSLCERGRWVKQLCPYGQAYSPALGTCVEDSSCTKFIGNCAGGKKIRISCNEYMECCWDGYYHKKVCPLFHSWNVEQQQCTFDTTCNPRSVSGCTEGQIVESWDCQHYFQCIAGHWQQFLCSNGLKNGGCRRCINGAYQRQLGSHLECINGRTQHDPNNCAFYRRCIDGQWKRQQCQNGFMWNQKLNRCDLFSDCPHYRRANCMENERIPYFDGVNCDGYFECSRGLWSLYQCPNGHVFDARVNRCMQSYSGCSAVGKLPLHPVIRPPFGYNEKYGRVSYYTGSSDKPTDVGCEIGTFLPDDYDCSRYYTCTKTGLIASACLPNMGFNPVTRLCEKTFQCNTNKCIDGQLKSGSICGQYLKCNDGQWEPKKCPGTQYFAAGKCHSSFGQCGTLPQSKCFNGQVMPIDADCSSYLLCQDGLYQRRNCHYGTLFDPTARYCSRSYSCPFCKTGQIIPYKNYCSDYMVCKGGHYEHNRCSVNEHFDKDKLQCVPGSCNISVAEMESCLENPGPLGYRPHPTDKGLFMQCAHGRWISRRCPTGLVWNQTKLVCDWPSKQAL